MLRILYVAQYDSGSTSRNRGEALRRLGNTVILFNLSDFQYSLPLLNYLQFRLPLGPFVARVNRTLLAVVEREQPDLIWFDKPIWFTPTTIAEIRRRGIRTVCYNQDNPYGLRRDGCWLQFKRVAPLFDLHCLFRSIDVERYAAMQLPFIRTQFSYDPAQNFPPPPSWSDASRTREVSYVGSPYEERPAFLRSLLLQHHLPVVISGPRWDKFLSPAEQLQWMRGGMLKDAAYRQALWQSKINLAFVTRLNEDDVAHKAFEITACGAFLLALRCPGHQAAFVEGVEAEFFSSVDECAEKIRYYLAHPAERQAIAQRGLERACTSGYDNDTQLARILEHLATL